MFDTRRRVRCVIAGLGSLCCRSSSATRRSTDDNMRTFAMPIVNRSWTDSQSKKRSKGWSSSPSCSSVTRRRLIVVVLFVILVTGFLLSHGGEWSLGDDDTTSYFRLHSPPRSPSDLARLLRQSVLDSRGSWRCAGDGDSSVRNVTRDGSASCRPKKPMLAAVTPAHPTVYSTTGINCKAMFDGDKAEMQAARRYMEIHPKGSASNRKPTLSSFLNGTTDCADFRRKRGYFDEPLSRAEAEFPIAYSILMYDNVPQVSLLFSAIDAVVHIIHIIQLALYDSATSNHCMHWF